MVMYSTVGEGVLFRISQEFIARGLCSPFFFVLVVLLHSMDTVEKRMILCELIEKVESTVEPDEIAVE